MPAWKKVTTAFVLFALASVPTAVWAGMQRLQQHEHGSEAGHPPHDPGLAELAEILVHGHEHGEEGVPDHQHSFLPSPPLRPVQSVDIQASDFTPVQAPDSGTVLLAGTRAWRERIGLSGSSPPRLHLLCILLI